MIRLLLIGLLLSASDSTSLAPATVVAARHRVALEALASPSSIVKEEDIAAHGIVRPNSLSAFIPGLYIPDYGASLTSTIYIRGMGSRMENPSLALYIDDIPILDKNAYDFDWTTIERAQMLRGPQGTLYGRNSMGGVLSLYTPDASQKPGWQGFLEAGTAETLKMGLSYGSGNHMVTAGFHRHSGYFPNANTGRNCDPFTGGSLAWKWERPLSPQTSISNTLLVNLSHEGGFAYGLYTGGQIHPVAYNDEGSYRRLSLVNGTKIQHRGSKLLWDAAGSLQVLADRMRMDQDYTPQSIFTLEQRQGSGALTAELTVRPTKRYRHWNPVTGAFGFLKGNRMNAPVTFKEEGIQTLILDSSNRNIPEGMGHLEIQESEFPVETDFTIWTWNAALFHESVFTAGRWTLSAGIRLHYEGGNMAYDSEALIHYRFVPNMAREKAFQTLLRGSIGQHSLELLPKLSALYHYKNLALYGTLSKGFRAGGFNTQIFSDILQSQMMNGLMADLGVYLDNPMPSVGAGHTVYEPEEAWNAEVGLRYRKGSFRAELAAYHIDCLHQQLTVFPPGKSIGRMMTNAGRSESLGIEAQAQGKIGNLGLRAAYSWCRARFVDYQDGNADFGGSRLPYVPEHTLFAGANYPFPLLGHELRLSADVRGAGPFWWNEENSLREPFSLTFGTGLAVELGKVELYGRAENLEGRQHPNFYFKSVGNEFFSLTKPRRLTLGIRFKI